MSQSVSLNEFIEQGYELEKLKPYEDFLIECSQKDYTDQGTHKHHVLPRFMKGSNKKTNLIELSYYDHGIAHLKLSECFELGTKEFKGNINSASHLQVWVKNPEYSQIISERMKGKFVGELNHFFGKHHTEESKKKFKESRIYLKGPENPLFGIKRGPQSIELIQKRIDGVKKFWKEKGLPEGIFECEEVINGKKKYYFRICPNNECQEKMYYGDVDRYDIYNAHRKNKTCRKCSTAKVNIIDNDTGEVYTSKKDVKIKFDLTQHSLQRLLDSGKFTEIVDDKYKNRIDNLKKSRNRKTCGKDQGSACRVIVLETNEIFETVSEFIRQKDIPYCRYKKMKDTNQILVEKWADIENQLRNIDGSV